MANLNDIVAEHIRKSMESRQEEQLMENEQIMNDEEDFNEEYEEQFESDYSLVLEHVMPIAISSGMGALSFRNRLRTLRR